MRAFLSDQLQTRGLDSLGELTELLTSELVNNVVCHVGSPMTIRVRQHGSTVRVEVDDESPEFPVLARPDDASALHGRGLVLVDALASDWGTRLNEHGKTVWFELDGKAAVAIEAEDV